MRIRPDKPDIEKAARLLIEAKNPLLSIGDEITQCRGEKELLELAELLGLPVSGQASSLGFWSKPFPTRHPLYIGTICAPCASPAQSTCTSISVGSTASNTCLARRRYRSGAIR